MATDPYLLERIRTLMLEKSTPYIEKRMFGGDCFMVDDKMCFGTYQGGLMARVAPEDVNTLLLKPGAEQMVHGGREMKGYLFIRPEGYDKDEELEFWINNCLKFNPRAKSSKKKK